MIDALTGWKNNPGTSLDIAEVGEFPGNPHAVGPVLLLGFGTGPYTAILEQEGYSYIVENLTKITYNRGRIIALTDWYGRSFAVVDARDR